MNKNRALKNMDKQRDLQVRHLHIFRSLAVAMLVGYVLLGWSELASKTPWGEMGFPIRYTVPNPPCEVPNSFNGCGYSYDILLYALDYLFWVAVALPFVLGGDLLWNRHADSHLSPSDYGFTL